MAETEKTKTPATPEQKARRKAVKLMGYTKFRQEWRAANPEGTKEQRKEAWAGARKDEIKMARLALRAMEKSGLKVVPAEA